MEGQARPPQLVGTNYAYWKARTKIYLQAQSVNVWRAVTNGWEHPTPIKEDETIELTPTDQWTAAQITECDNNNKALNTVTRSHDESQFGLIAGCSQAKEAWEFLQNCYEGDSSVKQSKLQQIHTIFEELRMQEDESIVQFNTRVQDLKNEAIVLGKTFPPNKHACDHCHRDLG